MTNQILYQIALTHLAEIGVITAKNLVSYCGGVQGVFEAKKNHLEKIPNIGTVRAQAILASKTEALKLAEAEIKFIEKNNLKPLFYTDENFPKRLLQCADSPVLLYYKGNANLNTRKIISIVGTRRITEYGKNQCEKLVEQLAAYQPLIISGLAYGVDITAHKSALKNKLETVGVVANGMDKMYPSAHVKYIKQMVECGGILTEYGFGEVANKENFPQRNRIVAGMCDAMIVIETAIKGGAMITAKLADSYNRDVFALPGKVGDIYSEGCNYLIKNNQATLFESADDIIKQLMWDVELLKPTTQQTLLFVDLSNDEKLIVDALQMGQTGIDDLINTTQLSHTATAGLLLQLELKGIVKAMPGKLFKL
ncbi:MAG: DNA-protecting protein DprA [Bacteroidota bacterium]|jgi:DNA processing protein